MPGQCIPCVGAIVKDGAGRLLLIKRGHDPEAGRWSLPGGRVEPGESDQDALVRCQHLAGSVERNGPGGTVLQIRDYAATVTGGTLTAGDDAADARWVSAADLDSLPLTSGLAEALRGWGVLG